MELSLRPYYCKNDKMAPLRWSPVWCLPQRLRCQSQYKKAFRKITQNNKLMNAFKCVSVPCVGTVRALYMFPQHLAVVVVMVALMPLLVTPHAQ